MLNLTEVKLSFACRPSRPKGGAEVQLRRFLTCVQLGCQRSASWPGRFAPLRFPINGKCSGPTACLGGFGSENYLVSLPGIEHRTFQPTAGHEHKREVYISTLSAPDSWGNRVQNFGCTPYLLQPTQQNSSNLGNGAQAGADC